MDFIKNGFTFFKSASTFNLIGRRGNGEGKYFIVSKIKGVDFSKAFHSNSLNFVSQTFFIFRGKRGRGADSVQYVGLEVSSFIGILYVQRSFTSSLSLFNPPFDILPILFEITQFCIKICTFLI